MRSLCPPALLVALLGLGVAAADATPSDRSDAVAVLRKWLEDDDSTLKNIWSGSAHPLNYAYNASIAASARETDPGYDRCLDDIQYVLNTRELWAFRMLDASVKVPEGLLALSWIHLGNWDECVAVRDVPRASNEEESFHGQMCLVTIGVNLGALDQQNLQRHSVRLLEDLSRDVDSATVLASLQLQLASCVPSSCTAHHVQTLFRSALYSVDPDEVDDLLVVLRVEDSMCTTQDSPPFDTADWVAVGLLSALGLVLVMSTTYDVVMPHERKSPLLVSFSVVANGRKLVAAPRKEGDQTLSSVHGIRFLSMCWVVLGHRYLITISYPNINPMFFFDFMEDPWRVGITNATLSVDTFFVLSGLLVGYLFFKHTPSKRKLNLPMYYIHRYVRLTPAFAVMILVNATLLGHVGWGPWWTANLEVLREDCKDTWWNLLLYVQNFVSPGTNCVGQSWYLMVDMQLYWLSPLLLIPLVRWPRMSLAAVGGLIVAELVGVFVECYVLDLPGSIFANTDVNTKLTYYKYVYVSTYTRFIPYLLGMCLGYFLGDREAKGQTPHPLCRAVVAAAWAAVAAMLLVPLFTGSEFLQTPAPGRVASAFFNALHRPAWGLGVAGVAYLCSSGYGGPVNRFLSWEGFQVLGRLSYCMYLVHWSLQSVELGTTRTYTYLSDSVILANYASDMLVAFLLAAVLSVAAEGPFMALEKALLDVVRQRRPAPAQEAALHKHKTGV